MTSPSHALSSSKLIQIHSPLHPITSNDGDVKESRENKVLGRKRWRRRRKREEEKEEVEVEEGTGEK
jgi:hypothetical protein